MAYRSEGGTDGSRLGGLTQEGTVISNMPLLFADGYPTCLDTMTESQLEKFIPFMIHCALGINPYENAHIGPPAWWPCSVKFKFPLVKPRNFVINGKWTKTLKSLVNRCYVHHDCQFMLNFSDELVTTPASLMKFIDLCDGTTELRDKRTSKLLVTFRNENRAYDKVLESPRRHMQLLPRSPRSDKAPLCTDIYLCESCDAEFETLAQVKSHELSCHREQSRDEPSAEPEDEPEGPVGERLNKQGRFLGQFGLAEALHGGHDAGRVPPTPKRSAAKRRHQGSVSFSRCSAVPISSPMGRALLKKKARSIFNAAPLMAERVERHCSKPFVAKLPPTMATRTRWKRYAGEDAWSHTYTFSARDRRERYAALRTGLNERSRYLLSKCKKLKIILKRLTDMDIKMYKLAREAEAAAAVEAASQRSENQVKLPWRKSQSSVNLPDIPLIDLCVSSSDEEVQEDVHQVASQGLSQGVYQGVSSNGVYASERNPSVLLQQLTRSSSSPYRLNLPNDNNVNVKIEPQCIQKRMKSQSSGPSENRVLGIPFLARKPSTHKFFHHLDPDSKGKLKELNKIKKSSCVTPKVNWSVKCSETR